MDGPDKGPAKRLAECLELPGKMRDSLNDFLFHSLLSGPQALAEHLVSQCNVEPELAASTSSTLWENQILESRVIPGAKNVLHDLRSNGVPYAFVSNIWVPFYQGFEQLFKEEINGRHCFLSFELGISKPDKTIYEVALARLSLKPHEVVMVGDTYENDIAPVMTMGMKTIWVLRRPDKEQQSIIKVINGRLPAPNYTLGSMEHLDRNILDSLTTF